MKRYCLCWFPLTNSSAFYSPNRNHPPQSKSTPANHPTLLLQHRRHIWIPPMWLRPLLRPLLVIVGGFIGGVILQLWKGDPPKWSSMLSASSEAEAAAVSGGGQYIGKICGGSAVLAVLYLTRLRNPLYIAMIGTTESKLKLAENQAALPWNAMWDSRSANDSMRARLSAMERYLGEAMSAAESGKSTEIQNKVDSIRQQGYSNGIKVTLERAEFWAESGEITKLEQTMDQLRKYEAEGGILDKKEMERVRSKAYGTRCSTLLANAQMFSNKGDVSKCQSALSEIRSIQNDLNGTFVDSKQLDDVLNRAHGHHVQHMLNEARNVKQSGSRRNAKQMIDQARQYAELHNVSFDEAGASKIL